MFEELTLEAFLGNYSLVLNNMGVEVVNTMFEELALEAFFVNCSTSDHNHDCALDVTTKGENMR